MRSIVSVLFLAACAPQFEATYEPTGEWTYSDSKGSDEGCAEAFLTGIQEPVTLTGSFPEFESADLTSGSIEILGETIELEIDAATQQDTSKGFDVAGTEVRYDFEGISWALEFVDYETGHQCGDCDDQIVVRLFVDGVCGPWPVYVP